MFVSGLGTAVPAQRFTQLDCLDTLKQNELFERLRPRSQYLVEKILGHPHGIATRWLALDQLKDAFQLDADVLHNRFATHAPELAEQAARRALAEAGLEPDQMDAVLISTCTGYLCPGLTSYVTERLGLKPNVIALDLVGQGCGAALPNFRAAEALLQANQASHVLSICVEICSAAFYLDDDPGVLVSACLFGDGAGAAVLSRNQIKPGALEWVCGTTLTNPADRELLRFKQDKGLLRNVLSPKVPPVAARYAHAVFESTLRERDLQREDISSWIWHAGGKSVLDEIQLALQLDDHDVRHSRAMLSEYGNLSSAFVYFVLQAALAEPTSPGWWWMSSFGAGFTCHGALLRIAA
jgi:predicted naringenin-chalcone synthase